MVSVHPSPLLVDIGAAIADAGGVIQYGLVFLFAALPWVEILVVIPVAIGVGLNPIATGVIAFAGNVGSVYVLLLFHRRIARWRKRRGPKPEADENTTKRRHKWARSVWDRYGLPGLSLAAPVLTGVHLAALLALAAGSRSRAVGSWMTVGIAAWAVALVAGSVVGVSLIGIS